MMSSGIRNTKQRNAILAALQKNVQPVTAEELAKLVWQTLPGVALSTVYRNLERLCEQNAVNRLLFTDGIARYEIPSRGHGHYLICTDCRQKVRIEGCPLTELSNRLEQETGFSVHGHDLQLYGTCPNCRKK